MHDVADVVAAELDELAPPDDTTLDWPDVLGRAQRDSRSPRLVPVAAVAVLAVAIAVPAVGFSAGVRGLLGLRHPAPVLQRAVPLVSARVGNDFYAHLWRSPSTTGGTCVFSTFDHSPREPTVPRFWRGGGSCSVGRRVSLSPTTPLKPLAVSLFIERRLDGPRKWVPPVIAGSADPSLHATRVAVRWRGGLHDLTLRNGWFIGGSRGLYLPPLRKFPFFVVAYDRPGREVARKKLDSPSLLLLQHGWKEFARKYHAWKRRR
jgi:hypothetical protein